MWHKIVFEARDEGDPHNKATFDLSFTMHFVPLFLQIPDAVTSLEFRSRFRQYRHFPDRHGFSLVSQRKPSELLQSREDEHSCLTHTTLGLANNIRLLDSLRDALVLH